MYNMNNLKKYIRGDYTDAEFEAFSEQLITQKLDRDKRKEWTYKLKERYGVERASSIEEKPSFGKKQWIIISSIAASLLLLVSFFFVLPAINTPAYLQAVNQQIDNLSIMGDQSVIRKGPQDVELTRKQANLAYMNKEYAKSIQLWEAMVTTNQATGLDFFYLALCQLQKSPPAPQRTIQALLKAKTLNGPEEEINWILALAYVKAEEIDQAKILLARIVKDQAYQAPAAKKILDLLP